MSKKPFLVVSLILGVAAIVAALLMFLLAPTSTLVLEIVLLIVGVLSLAMGAVISKQNR